MSFHGRSLDDLPLAAYSTGVVPDEVEELEPAAEGGSPEPPSGFASSPSHEQGSTVQSSTDPGPGARAAGPRRFSLRLPIRIPALRRKAAPIDAASAPFQPVHRAGETAPALAAPMAAPRMTTAPMAATPMPAAPPFAASTFAGPVYGPAALGATTVAPPPGSKRFGTKLFGANPFGAISRDPQVLLRDPRVLAGGAVAIGLVLLAISVLGGGGPGSGSSGPGQSQDTTAGQPSAAPDGNATVELTSGLPGMYALSGLTGAGPAVDSKLDATWADEFGDTLALLGPASAGTRTTDESFVLTWSMLVHGAPVTFKSAAGECTVGMAVGAKAVNGTFVCKKLKSDDGRTTIDVRGTYRT
jgi:hypothetical protein